MAKKIRFLYLFFISSYVILLAHMFLNTLLISSSSLSLSLSLVWKKNYSCGLSLAFSNCNVFCIFVMPAQSTRNWTTFLILLTPWIRWLQYARSAQHLQDRLVLLLFLRQVRSSIVLSAQQLVPPSIHRSVHPLQLSIRRPVHRLQASSHQQVLQVCSKQTMELLLHKCVCCKQHFFSLSIYIGLFRYCTMLEPLVLITLLFFFFSSLHPLPNTFISPFIVTLFVLRFHSNLEYLFLHCLCYFITLLCVCVCCVHFRQMEHSICCSLPK